MAVDAPSVPPQRGGGAAGALLPGVEVHCSCVAKRLGTAPEDGEELAGLLFHSVPITDWTWSSEHKSQEVRFVPT